MAKNRQEALLKFLDPDLLCSDRAFGDDKGAQVLFRLSALGEIASDVREPDQGAVGRPKRRDDDISPEPRTILANVPAVISAHSLARCHLQLALTLASGHVLWRIERREVLPDNLLGRIPVETLDAGVPSCDSIPLGSNMKIA